jgi:murein DD-endopeptidase MepM/ murein hydrolase activator NlpD
MVQVLLPPAGLGYGAVQGLVTNLDGSPLLASCSSPFGPRDPIQTGAGATSPFHCGSDFPWSEGAPILNPTPWLLVVTAEGAAINGYGNVVFCAVAEGPHAGQSLVFAHLKPGLHAGRFQVVQPGGVIGQLGNTGASTGPHVHVGVLKSTVPYVTDINEWIDPAFWDDPIPWLAAI